MNSLQLDRLPAQVQPAKRLLNPDQQVNFGCNLKWKLGRNRNDSLFTTVLFRGHASLRRKRNVSFSQ
ncbi:MAG: hypothetical protein ACFBSC_02215 [Microcoleaceae cyanobacterium]